MDTTARIAIGVLLIGLLARSEPAHAQSFRLDRFRAAERADDGFGVRRLGSFAHLSAGAVLTLDYAHDPLTIERNGDREVQAVVDDEVSLSLALSLGLWDRVIAFASLEAVPRLEGPAVPVGFVPKADGAGLGDLALGARVRLMGMEDDFFALGAQAALTVPTAGTQAYRGEDGVSVRPELIAELRPRPARVSVNLGTLVRSEQRLADARVGSELIYGVAAGVKVIDPLELIAELTGGFGLKDFGARDATHCEWRLGARLLSHYGLSLAAAAGTGFTAGVGSPDARVIGQLGYLMPRRTRASAPTPAPPEVARDGDGDGLADARDRCPLEAEDRDDFEDADGCPELDDDADGVPDAGDACRTIAEDHDGFEDGNGCPDHDNDQDGVLDADDACPDVLGVVEQRGCPAPPAPATLTEDGSVEILEQILFATNQAEILPESFATLAGVAGILAQHPRILKLRIEGHTDDVGAAFKNLALSVARAAAVTRWLAEHGVAPARLEGVGCGELHPVRAEATEAARAQNRRVVFQVVEPAPDSTRAKRPAGCQLVR